MEDPALPGPGDIVAGKYRIEREIGRGGMSVVFGAMHEVTGKRFAIKWLMPDEEGVIRAEAAQRFIREAQVAGRFQHPNVVEVYDVGEVDGSYYMVMEWLEGESLAERLDDRGPFSFAETCRYLIPCLKGIEEAHQSGIVHRDLKPANIFVCNATKHATEHMKVLDFGIAKLELRAGDVDPRVTKTGVLIGTPYYLSLEQLRSQPIDHRADVYAFGVMLYQLLSGELPFPSENFGELVLQIATATPLPIRQRVPNLPLGVEELVMRAMARDAGDRFQDLGSLIALMERINSETRAARASTRRAPLTPSRPSLQTPMATEASVVPPTATLPAAREPALKFKGVYAAILVVTLAAIGWLLHGYYDRQSLAERESRPLPPLTASAAPSETESAQNAVTGVGSHEGSHVGTLPTAAAQPLTLEPDLPPQAAAIEAPQDLRQALQPVADPRRSDSARPAHFRPPTAARLQTRANSALASPAEPQAIAVPTVRNEAVDDPTPHSRPEEKHNPLHMQIQ